MSCFLVCHASAPVGPNYGNALTILDELGKHATATYALKFAESDNCTVNLLGAIETVKAHYHAKHDENVVVLRGSGVFTLDGEKHSIKIGDVMHIPKGKVHSFVPSSKDVAVVSIFAPKFDGVDRIFVDGD